MPQPDPQRVIKCIKLGEELPGLARPPFPTELGNFVFENVSFDAWDQWLKESVRYINTCRWQLDQPEDREKYMGQLRIWLGLEDGEMMKTAWTPPSD